MLFVCLLSANKVYIRPLFSGTAVHCGNRGLTSFPVDDVPRDVTELYLDRNIIKQLPESIGSFTQLETLSVFNAKTANCVIV